MAVAIPLVKVEFGALAHLALVSLRVLIWMNKKNIATSAAAKCHYIMNFALQSVVFTDAYLQCYLYLFIMDQRKFDGWHSFSNPIAHLVNLCVDSGYDGVKPNNLLNKGLVFLFDEAQQSYSDLKLWLGIKKTQSCATSGPGICLFST